MRTKPFPFPLEAITVELERDRPRRDPANGDVAFALVTRFNVRMSIGKQNRWSHLGWRHLAESEEYESFWMQRLALFERVCIPSVLALTPRPDVWFIAFGDVDSWFVRELLQRLRPYPWIRPYIRKKGEPDNAPALTALLTDFARERGASFLCSTRFDSDDSLHGQFAGGLDRAIGQLRERAFPDEPRALSFVFGLMQSGGELSVFLRRTNMFTSVFEPVDRVAGPYAGSHEDVRDRMPLVEIVTNLPMWIYQRHENTLEPSWVTTRDRLALNDPREVYPQFGFELPDDGRDRNGAARLRDTAYWDAERYRMAVELATQAGQTTIARWLEIGPSTEIEAGDVLRELEDGSFLLNAAHLARLARELRDTGDAGAALRAYDYAVLLAPADRHVRAERDSLAGSLAFELDLDEQLELTAPKAGGRAPSNIVALIAAAEIPNLVSTRERIDDLMAAGFAPVVFLVWNPEEPNDESAELMQGFPGVSVEVLQATGGLGLDAAHRAVSRQLGDRIAALKPCLLLPDDSTVAQRLAAAVGRAFGIPVEFAPFVAKASFEEERKQ